MFDEISTAANIKSKLTRSGVIEALKKIYQYVKTLKKLPVNGVAFFANDNLTIIEPPQPITQFIYKCDKVFHVEPLYDLYKEHDEYGIVLVSGSECYFYTHNTLNTKLISKMNVSLQSRQKKGGQSAVRIARLAEERRYLYVKQIVEKINEVYLEVKKLVIAGPSEMKTNIVECELLDYRIKTLLLPVVTIDILSIHKVLELNLFSPTTEDDLLCMELIDKIKQNDSRYVYGIDYIQQYIDANNCNTLYVHHSIQHHFTVETKVIVSNTQYGKLLCDYGGMILLNYYPMDI